uniref:TBC1 domain family member 12 n=1 Tax=Cacopsylla melanoneura TaxID=428564 RepID=A0A8D8WGZ3_9HEMI
MNFNSKNINSTAENKQLLDQNLENSVNNNEISDINTSLTRVRLFSSNEACGGSEPNVNRSEYSKCDTRSGTDTNVIINRSATDGAMNKSNAEKQQSSGSRPNSFVKSHCRNNSYDGLLMHSRHNSESCSSSVGSTSSSTHSRHNSGDSGSLFSKNIFEWRSSSNSDLDLSTAPSGGVSGRPPSKSNSFTTGGGLFKWNLFGKHFEAPCMADNSDGLSVHSNTSTLSNHSSGTMPRDKSFETLTVSSTALIPHDRPKELPAKSEQEKLKHEKEYLKMLENIKKKEEQESKLKKKQLAVQLKNEEQQANAVKVWTQEILPHWESMKSSRKTRDLWWKGLPPCVRSKVWTLAIGNELTITRTIYDQCMKDAEARSQDIYDNTITQIRLDISRTFPHLCLFQIQGPYYNTLHLMLASYVSYNNRISYVQGMSYICALFILNISSLYEAFVCFCNFLHKSVFHVFYTLNIRMMQAYYATYNDLFKYNLPKLHRHFHSSGLTPDLYLLDWIYTLFTKAMSLDLVCKVWDVVMRDGEEFIFRAALGILHLHEDTLLDMDFLQGSKFLTKLPDNLDSDTLFKSIAQMSTSIYRKSYQTILNHHKSYV